MIDTIEKYKEEVKILLLKKMSEEEAEALMKKNDQDLQEYMILGWGPQVAVDSMLMGYN